jgi:hypothetical protein
MMTLSDYVNQIKEDEQSSHGYRAKSAFSMLNHVDLMIQRYLDEPQNHKGAILLDVFGLLQGLFVAIDALYDLAIGLTKYKYHINVNSNPILHELKYIRNDIVGHPTHRTYPDGGMGFSLLTTEDMTKECFHYKTYIFEKNKLEVKTKDVKTRPLIEAYFEEKKEILDGLLNYLSHKDLEVRLSDDIYLLYETINEKALKKIKEKFMEIYEIDEKKPHRFLWRIRLLEKLISWHDDDLEVNTFLLYLSKVQAAKLYEIALNMENRKGKDLYTPIPSLLKAFYKFIGKNEQVLSPFIQNLHDFNYPLFHSDINALKQMNPNDKAMKLIAFLESQKDESNAYLIGSAMKNYRPKQK